jgi:two-component system, response regulator RegA
VGASDVVDSPTGELLLVDDDPVFVRVVTRALQGRGFNVRSVSSLEDATQALGSTQRRLDFAVLDLNLAGDSGLKLIAPIKAISPNCRILVLTGYASLATAVEAVRLGAVQYLAKPVDLDTIVGALICDHQPNAELVPDALAARLVDQKPCSGAVNFPDLNDASVRSLPIVSLALACAVIEGGAPTDRTE